MWTSRRILPSILKECSILFRDSWRQLPEVFADSTVTLNPFAFTLDICDQPINCVFSQSFWPQRNLDRQEAGIL